MNIAGIGVWEIAVWSLGAFGLAGTIALLLVAPSTFGIAIRALVKLLGLVLSYRLGCALVAAILAALIVDYWRHSTDDAEFTKRTALFEHAQKERDARVATEIREEVWTEIANATAENVIIDQDVKEITDGPPPPPAPASDPFRIDSVSRKQLCIIAGQTGCGSSGSQRVQAPRRAGHHPADRRLPQGVGARAGRPAQGK